MRYDIEQHSSNCSRIRTFSFDRSNKRRTAGFQGLLRRQASHLFRPGVLLSVLALLVIQTAAGFAQEGWGDSEGAEQAKEMDVLVFGDEDSESAHDLTPETSRIIKGKDDTSARQIMESAPKEGMGSVSFTMACHPSKRTYLTLKLQALPDDWAPVMLSDGDDIVGYQGLKQHNWPPANYMKTKKSEKHSEWWYTTIRIPMFMTEGKSEVELRLVNWASPWDEPEEGPSEPLYRAYTHTDPMFELPPDDTGVADFDLGKVAGPPEDPYDSMHERINETVRKKSGKRRWATLLGLAMAYSRGDWIDTVDQKAILNKVKSAIDGRAKAQVGRDIPGRLFRKKHNGWRAWSEHGKIARAYTLLHEAFEKEGLLSETLEDHPEEGITRREAYIQFFDRAMWWRARDRKDIHNQFVIITLGLVRMHQALEKLAPDQYPATIDQWVDKDTISRMVPKPDPDDPVVDRWIDEAIGLAGVTNPPDARRKSHLFKDGSYRMASEAGIGKEFGWSMSYSGISMEHTAKLAIETGLERVKEHTAKMARAMGAMSWWVQDAKKGLRDSATDGTFGGRTRAHPGQQSAGFGASPMENFLVVGDEATQAWAEAYVEHGHEGAGGWKLPSLIYAFEGYRKLQEQEEPSDYVLGIDRKRYVWSDEDVGIVTVVDGDTHIKARLGLGMLSAAYDWGVSEAARVHYHGPKGDRVITVNMDRVDFPFAGDTWERPNNVAHAWGAHNPTYTKYLPWRHERVEIDQALAGRELKQACKPNGESWPGADKTHKEMKAPDPRVGTGIHYRQLRIDSYLIGMNSTGAPERGRGPGKEYEMEVPEGTVVDVATGEEVTGDTVTIQPRTTKVLKVQAE